MAGYCTRGQMYLYEPKASENAAYECNIQPFFTFTSAIMCLLPTFTIIIVHAFIYYNGHFNAQK